MAQMTNPCTDFMTDEDVYNFFRQLWDIISDSEYQYFSTVRWIKDGDAFRIVDPDKFCKEVCPKIWKGCTCSYFEYVAFACDFEKVDSGFLEYRNCNSDFVEEGYERLKNIKPKKPVQTVRAFLGLPKNSFEYENSNHQINSTSVNDFSLEEATELKNTEHISKQIFCTSDKYFPSDVETSQLKIKGENSNKVESSTGRDSSLDAKSSELRNTDENSNYRVSSTSGKDSPSNIDYSEIKNTVDKSNRQRSISEKQTFPLQFEECAVGNTSENSSEQISSTAEVSRSTVASEVKSTDGNLNREITSQSDVGVPEMRNYQQTLSTTVCKYFWKTCGQKNVEISNSEMSFTSGTYASSDVGASASLHKPCEQTDEMSQEDIYKFLKELWNILSDDEFQYFPVVRWMKRGKIFRIIDSLKFYKEVCPKLCDSCTFDYFEYFVFACGFEAIPPNFVDFYHEDFLEDDFERLKKIKPKKTILSPRAFFKTSRETPENDPHHISSKKESVIIDKFDSSHTHNLICKDQEEELDESDLKTGVEPSKEKEMVYIDLLAENVPVPLLVPNSLEALSKSNLDQVSSDDYSPISSLSSPEDILRYPSAEAPNPSCSEV